MAQRTSEEILAQREAWMARKAARESGQDVPIQPPLSPGEVAPEPVAAEAANPEPAVAPPPAEPVASQAVSEPAPEPVAAAPVKTIGPTSPAEKRSPEEILAQREAWMARKAAKAAGQTAPPAAAPAAAAPAVAVATAAPPAKPAVAIAKPAPARKPAVKAAEPEVDPNLTRREFLNYAWLASIALFSVEAVGLSLWFAFPNFKAGQFGGAFDLGEANGVLPEVNSGPVAYSAGKFWLVNVDTEFNGEPRKGIMAIYKVCTHLGCLYEWVPMSDRFQCPCHGSKFALTGDYLGGPARRSLDRFVVEAISPDGSVKKTDLETGGPLEINGDEMLIVDTGQKILGSSDIVIA